MKRGRKTSFFIFLLLILQGMGGKHLFAQGDMPFNKDSVRNFVFTAESGQIATRMKHRLNPQENFVKLEGNSATIQVVSLFNDEMGRNGLGGVTHKGKISRLEIFKKKDLIEVSFLVSAARTMISVSMRFWDDGETKVTLEPLNTSIGLDLFGKLYKLGSVSLSEGANR